MHKIFKIKKDKVGAWQDWLLKLATIYKEEARQTLKKEGIGVESYAVFTFNDQSFCIITYSNAPIAEADPEHWLNKMHNSKKKECFEGAVPHEEVSINAAEK
jgi:hypothetical protein